MALTNAQVAQLNSMCMSANSTALGTAIQTLQNLFAKGVYTAIAADQTATTVTIPVGMTVTGFIVQILRVGKDVTSLAAISASTTNIVVATNGGSYVLTTGDVINYIVY